MNPESFSPHHPRRSRAGFSLVEVTLALGVVAVALTSLLALVPGGMNIFRDSMESTLRADVLRKLSAEFQQTPFERLDQADQEMRYFTTDGTEVSAADQGFFGVRCALKASTRFVTGGEDAAYDNVYLRPVQVQFFSRADQARQPLTPSYVTTLFVPERGL